MNTSYQADIHDSYTPSQLWIATNLFLTFQLVSCTRVDVFNSYEYGECLVLVKPTLVTHTRLPNLLFPHIFFYILECKLNSSSWILLL